MYVYTKQSQGDIFNKKYKLWTRTITPFYTDPHRYTHTSTHIHKARIHTRHACTHTHILHAHTHTLSRTPTHSKTPTHSHPPRSLNSRICTNVISFYKLFKNLTADGIKEFASLFVRDCRDRSLRPDLAKTKYEWSGWVLSFITAVAFLLRWKWYTCSREDRSTPVIFSARRMMRWSFCLSFTVSWLNQTMMAYDITDSIRLRWNSCMISLWTLKLRRFLMK